MNAQGHADSRVKRQIASQQTGKSATLAARTCQVNSRCRLRHLIGGVMIPAP
jgi:hypothetical protein